MFSVLLQEYPSGVRGHFGCGDGAALPPPSAVRLPAYCLSRPFLLFHPDEAKPHQDEMD
jgi:hypothetical protein